MPKVRQKSLGRRGHAPSYTDSDSDTSELPRRSAGSAGKRKSVEPASRGGRAVQQSRSSGNTVEQNDAIDSEDEEMPATPATSNSTANTQQQRPSSVHADKQLAQMPEQDRQRLAVDIVHYLLTADYRKHPIKQMDIKKHALRDHSRVFNSLMPIAVEKLRSVYGIKVVETDIGKQKAYMLVNALDNKYDAPHQTWPPEDDAHMGLIMVILSVIFMKGNVVTEEDLYDLLSRLGITQDRPHETFGDIKHLIMTDFVRQGYLEVQREQGSDPPTHLFRWGARAKAETSKSHAMDFICQVFGDSSQRWAAQMRDIEQSQVAAAVAATAETEATAASCSRGSS